MKWHGKRLDLKAGQSWLDFLKKKEEEEE